MSYLNAIAESIAFDQYVSTTVLHFRRSHRRLRHRCRRRLVTVTVGTRTLVSGWSHIMERRRYGGVAALQRVVPAERDVERWLSTQDATLFTNR